MPSINGSRKSPINLARCKKPLRGRNAGGNGSNSAKKSSSKATEILKRMDLRSELRKRKRAVRINPEVADNWFDLGKLLMDVGQNQQAEAALQEALRRAPDSATYRYWLGNALGNNGKFPEAAAHFKHLAEIDPALQDPMSTIALSALRDLAYCLGEMGRWEGEAFATMQPASGIALSILADLAVFRANSKQYDHACTLYFAALLLALKLM